MSKTNYRQYINKVVEWITQNKILNAFEKTIGLISIFITVSAFTKFFGSIFTTYLKINKIGSFCSNIGDIGFEFTYLIALIASSWFYSESVNNKKVKYAAFTSLICFPFDLFNDNSSSFNMYILLESLIIGVLSAYLFNRIDNLKLKKVMIKGIPLNTFHSFRELMPIAITFLIFQVLVHIPNFENVFLKGMCILVSGLSGLPIILLVIFLQQLLWYIGIHGFEIIWKIINWIWMPIFFANIYKFASSLQFKNVTISPNTISNIYAMLGGSGSTIGLVLALLLVCKGESVGRKIGIQSFRPSLFAVNEPLIFGFPIVMNKSMFLPWLGVPLINAIISYIVTKIGWVVPIAFINIGGEPILISNWILGGFRLSPVILTLVLIILDTLLYLPFVLLAKKKGKI